MAITGHDGRTIHRATGAADVQWDHHRAGSGQRLAARRRAGRRRLHPGYPGRGPGHHHQDPQVHPVPDRPGEQGRAVAEEPDKLRQLLKQRFRWTFGGLQVMYKHRDMLFRRRYHSVGMFFLPYNVINVLVPLVFMPITYLVFGLNIASGNWRMLAIYATIFLAFEYISTIASILIVGGGWWHLWIVPLYRPINEPMRVYLLLRTIYEATRGQAVGWNPLKRTGGAVQAHLRESS